MNSKFLAIAGIAVIGALVSIGSADTVINAYVQQFGATPHTTIDPPGNARNVQIDWSFLPVPGSNQTDYNVINDCRLTFDQPLPNGTRVICKISGHDNNPTDGVHYFNESQIIGYGDVVLESDEQEVDVPILCDPNLDNPTGNYILPCDIQWIEDVKVITLGKETTDVVVGQPPPPPPPPAEEATLTIVAGANTGGPDDDYNPDPLTVEQGTIITVENTDSVIHTATSDTSGLFDTGIIAAGDSATIDTSDLDPGTYTFHCDIHSNMAGTLMVT